MTSSSAPGSRHRSWWIAPSLALLLLWAAALRIWMASSGLTSGHYWDERYSVKNLRAILEGGTLEPVNYYYPSLSYLPQAAVLAAIEGASGVFGEPFSFFADGSFAPSGYLLCRLIQVLYSLGTLLLTFLIGRRLISAEAGLVAALLLAVAPQHVRLSTMWKPDITLLLAILLALWWTLDALDRPSLGRYLLAGAGVGLALASKLNGGPIAAPLAIGAAVAGIKDRRHWWGLPAAGVTAAIVFVALNPQVGRYLDALERNQELYSRQVRGPDLTLPERIVQVAREEAGFVLSFNFHGPWIGIAAIAGLGAIAAAALLRRDRRNAPARARRAGVSGGVHRGLRRLDALRQGEQLPPDPALDRAGRGVPAGGGVVATRAAGTGARARGGRGGRAGGAHARGGGADPDLGVPHPGCGHLGDRDRDGHRAAATLERTHRLGGGAARRPGSGDQEDEGPAAPDRRSGGGAARSARPGRCRGLRRDATRGRRPSIASARRGSTTRRSRGSSRAGSSRAVPPSSRCSIRARRWETGQ